MPFQKSFPKTVKGFSYPQWEEVTLTPDEEIEQDKKARIENLRLMDQCIEDAKKIMEKRQLKPYQTDLVHIAIALFEKRASHAVYWKEHKAKEKFDQIFKK